MTLRTYQAEGRANLWSAPAYDAWGVQRVRAANSVIQSTRRGGAKSRGVGARVLVQASRRFKTLGRLPRRGYRPYPVGRTSGRGTSFPSGRGSAMPGDDELMLGREREGGRPQGRPLVLAAGGSLRLSHPRAASRGQDTPSAPAGRSCTRDHFPCNRSRSRHRGRCRVRSRTPRPPARCW